MNLMERGDRQLTHREVEILQLVADGATNKLIGAQLDISVRTVQKHLENAYAKLHVDTRTAAVRCLLREPEIRGEERGTDPRRESQRRVLAPS